MNSTAFPKIALAAFLIFLSLGIFNMARADIHGGKLYGDASRGYAVFSTWCADCHLATPHETDQVPTRHQLASNPARTDSVIRAFLDHPHSPMPPLELGNQQIEDILAYLHEVKAGEVAASHKTSP